MSKIQPPSAEAFLQAYQILISSETAVVRQRVDPAQLRRFQNDLMKGFTDQERLKANTDLDALGRLAKESDHARFHAERFLQLLSPAQRDVLSKIPIGSLPSLAFNAETLRSPSGDPIIGICSGLMATLFEVSSWYVASVPVARSQPEVDFAEATQMIFRLVVFHYTRSHEWLPPKPFRTTKYERMELAGGLFANAMNFVIGHEYGHVLLGHVADAGTVDHDCLKGGSIPPLKVFDFSHNREFEADLEGIRLVLTFSRANHHGWPGAGAAGAILALQFLRLREELFPPREPSRTHPPATERLHRARRAILNDAGDEWRSDVEAQIAPLDRIFDSIVTVGRGLVGKIG
jgi:hypothetical protein